MTNIHHLRRVAPQHRDGIVITCYCDVIFTARRSYASAVLGVVILSVCLCVCLSVCLSHACFVTNAKNLPAIFFIPHERAILLLFWCQRFRRNSNAVTPTGAPNRRRV